MKYINWRGEKISQFVLGTAQFGMVYGIANQKGKPKKKEVTEMLNIAFKAGVNILDTAQGYGDAEESLAKAFKDLRQGQNIHVISKIDPKLVPQNKAEILAEIEKSVNTFECPLWGMMLHDEQWLAQWDTLKEVFNIAKQNGWIRYAGVSVYSVKAAQMAINIPEIDIIQVPCNAWDQRMIDANILKRAKKQNKLCFIRSVFLQGLLLMPASEAKNKVQESYELAKDWEAYASEKKSSKSQLALGYASQFELPLVLGVDNVEQLKKNMDDFISNKYNGIHGASFRPDKISDFVLSPQLWNS